MRKIGTMAAIGLIAMSCALLIKHTISETSLLGEFLMGAGVGLLLLGIVVDKVGLDKVKAYKNKLFGHI